jgi:hypothetical protein
MTRCKLSALVLASPIAADLCDLTVRLLPLLLEAGRPAFRLRPRRALAGCRRLPGVGHDPGLRQSLSRADQLRPSPNAAGTKSTSWSTGQCPTRSTGRLGMRTE